MTGYLQLLIEFSAAHPSIIGLIVFACAGAEAIVILGAVFPGTSIVLALAGVAGAAHSDIWLLTCWAAAGAVVGDGVSFWIGHRYGDKLRTMWPFSRRPGLLDSGSTFFEGHGGKSVFFARFLPGVRAVVPVAAGMLGMTVARFYTANVASAVVWAVSHVLPAAGLGVAFSTLGNVSGRLAVLAGIALLIVILFYWLTNLTVNWVAPVAVNAYEEAIARLGNRPDPFSRRMAKIFDPSQPNFAAIALWSSLLVIAGIGFLGVLEDLIAGDPLVRADTAINHLIQSVRTPFADSVMAVITSLGDATVTGALVVIVVAWLSFRRTYATAVAVAFTMGIAAVFVPAMKAVLHKPRPIQIYSGADAFSFPSGHTTLATVLYGVVAVLISKSLPRPAQIVIFTVAGAIVGAVGLSRIYLSAHWPSDVLGGFLFGAASTAAFALVFERLPPQRVGRAGLATVTVISFVVLGTWHASSSFQENIARYAKQTPHTAFTISNWRDGSWQSLPAYRTDVAGEREEPLILQWAGPLNEFAAVLGNAGWSEARPWTSKDVLQFLNPTANFDSLPPLPLLHDGRFPALTLFQTIPSTTNQRLVFRAWPTQTGVIDQDIQTPLFLASITLEKLAHPFGLISTLRDVPPPRTDRNALSLAFNSASSVSVIIPVADRRRPPPVLATFISPSRPGKSSNGR